MERTLQQIFHHEMGHGDHCHHADFSTASSAWVREVLYKSLNLLAVFYNKYWSPFVFDIKMGLFLQMLMALAIMMVSLQGWLPLGCLEEERIALLHLKDALNYPNGTSLPSWIKGDAHCCDWESIICDSSTGRVTELDLEGVRDRELGDWYLNASLFLPFQQLNGLYLTANRIAGLVEKKGLLSYYKIFRLFRKIKQKLYLIPYIINIINHTTTTYIIKLPILL